MAYELLAKALGACAFVGLGGPAEVRFAESEGLVVGDVQAVVMLARSPVGAGHGEHSIRYDVVYLPVAVAVEVFAVASLDVGVRALARAENRVYPRAGHGVRTRVVAAGVDHGAVKGGDFGVVVVAVERSDVFQCYRGLMPERVDCAGD